MRVISEEETEFDADTRWAVTWYRQFGLNPGPYGSAETLSKAKNTSVAGVIEAGFAAGGTVAVAAQVAGVHRGTIYRWLRRGEQEATATEAALDPDAYTADDLRAIARTAGMMATSRMTKTELVDAIASHRSPFTDFTDNVKEVEAVTEFEWLGEIARIGRGEHLETVTTEEFDNTGAVTKRTTRTTTSHRPAWQAYAWLLERRHPERWGRDSRPGGSHRPRRGTNEADRRRTKKEVEAATVNDLRA